MKRKIELEKEVDKLKSDPQYIDFFSKIIRQKLGENREVIQKIILEAIENYQQNNEPKIYGKLLLLKFAFHSLYSEFNDAIKVGEELLQHLKIFPDEEAMMEVQVGLFRTYLKKGMFQEAICQREKVLSHLKEVKDSNIHTKLMFTTVKLYMSLKEYKKAEKQIQHIKGMDKWLNPKDSLYLYMLELEMALEQEQLEEATEYSHKAYGLAVQLKEEKHRECELGEVLRLRAILNAKRKLQMQPDKDFKEAAILNKSYPEAYVKTLLNWASYLIEEKKLDEAERKLNEAMPVMEEIDSNLLRVKASEVLRQLYETKEQWELAYQMVKDIQQYERGMSYNEIDLQDNELEGKLSLNEQNEFLSIYSHLQKIVNATQVLSASVTVEDLQEVIRKELANMIPMDVMGIAINEGSRLEYNMYDLEHKGWLARENDMVRHTMRLAERCTQLQVDMIIQNGSFEEYSIANIIHSTTGMKLQSIMIMHLKVEKQVIGAVTIGSYEADAYSQKDIETAKIMASYLGLILKNTHLYQEIDYLSEHDELTSLLSRRAILKNAERRFKENYKKCQKTAVILLDIDNFKSINRRYGYELGDVVLSKIGEIIKGYLRPEDYAGRYNGEEFMVILDGLNQEQANKVAEEIQTDLRKQVFDTKRDKNITATLSGGVYICDEYTLHFSDAIQFADHALYRAKLLGKNRIVDYQVSKSNKYA